MEQLRLTYLFNSYYNKTASAQERAEFLGIVAGSQHDEQLRGLLTEKWLKYENKREVLDAGQTDQMLSAILQFTPDVHHRIPEKQPIKQLMRYSAAAVIFLVMAVGIYALFAPQSSVSESALLTKNERKEIIQQGSKKAILTLGDGSEVVLDTVNQNLAIRQGNARISKQSLSTLAYHTEQASVRQVVYNTLSTPKGGQYQVILPDQTKVWLNSASSIRFPTQFKGKERRVTVTGEAYFEVSKNPDMPFKITANNTQVEVLGTHFNLMAYSDEVSVNTFLLEGSVRVSSRSETKVLVPGQESRINTDGKLHIGTAEEDEVLAWKNGWFNFNKCDIQMVMRQISRWYDVEVEYRSQIPAGHFSGVVSQANEISKVLDILRTGGVNFKTEGRKIIVLP